MSLRVVAVAAPDWISGSKNSLALNSRDPASLFNACRFAALQARTGVGGWGDSNWNTDRRSLRSKFQLLYSLDDTDNFLRLLLRERPNLLLIGAMTLCMPGAMECARLARAVLGDEVAIVLGGRHPTETVYLSGRRARGAEHVQHHAGSPLRLMASHRIYPVFDAVISGDGEFIIAALGEALARQPSAGRAGLVGAISALSPSIPGDWIVGWLDDDAPRALVSAGLPIDYGVLPSIAEIFGVSTSFDVFDGRMTAHVFSDAGPGCVYDCSFCSEGSSVTGGLRDASGSPNRLYRQLRQSCDVIKQDHGQRGASAFVEDSVMLAGSPRLIDRFVDLMEENPIDIVFGAQLTIDQILMRQSQLLRLSRVGLRYVFIGVETMNPNEIGGFSKDLNRARKSWESRLRDVLDILEDMRIRSGAAVLFGLGEPHGSRVELIETLSRMRESSGVLNPISANWAVQHPLRGRDGGANYEYLEWGTPEGPFLDCFHQFGEASVRYPLPNVGRPILAEVQELSGMLADLSESPRLLSKAG
jgi:B12-binding domain/radical SAM domain protein